MLILNSNNILCKKVQVEKKKSNKSGEVNYVFNLCLEDKLSFQFEN